MTNWRPQSPELYEDVHTKNHYANSDLKKSPKKHLHKLWRPSRDSARTLVQWDDSENAGFTTGKQWFPVNENYHQINVANQEKDPDSLLNFYRKAINLRKSLQVVREGTYKEHFHKNSRLYVYSRETEGQRLLVICSFAGVDTKIKIPHGFDLWRVSLSCKAIMKSLTAY